MNNSSEQIITRLSVERNTLKNELRDVHARFNELIESNKQLFAERDSLKKHLQKAQEVLKNPGSFAEQYQRLQFTCDKLQADKKEAVRIAVECLTKIKANIYEPDKICIFLLNYKKQFETLTGQKWEELRG